MCNSLQPRRSVKQTDKDEMQKCLQTKFKIFS